MTNLRAMVLSSAMTAAALVLPPAFHAAGLGSHFMPLLLPLVLNGFLVPVRWAVLAGAVAPLLSALLTGMPPIFPPIALSLAAEGAVLGGTAAALYGGGRRSVWTALVPAILLGRVTAFAGTWLIAQSFALPAALSAGASVAQGLPGVALQLVVVPIAVRELRKRPGLLFEHESEA
ncbi:MAG: ECF transporter S component [bacterium]|jgi:hypothetical protein